jgi:hypothetical protein
MSTNVKIEVDEQTADVLQARAAEGRQPATLTVGTTWQNCARTNGERLQSNFSPRTPEHR